MFNEPAALALDPDGGLYITDTNNERIRRIATALPGILPNDSLIPARDGREIYQFNDQGRHVRTLDSLTGATYYEFSYNSAGQLITITDGDNNVTTIERNVAGQPTTIVGPYGQRTQLFLNTNGYLERVINPANEQYQFNYTNGGLLLSLTNPRSFTATFAYDLLGRLIQDDDAAAGFTDLARLAPSENYTVTKTSALSRTTQYAVLFEDNGLERRINTFPNGLQSEFVIDSNSTESTHLPNGMQMFTQYGPDPRWKMRAPLSTEQTTTTPGGLTLTAITTRTASLGNPFNPLSLQSLNEVVAINGRTYTSLFGAASRTFTDTTPVGRQSFTTIDVQSRVIAEQVTGLALTNYTYDSRGRLATAAVGTGLEARVTTYSYNSEGYLASITDPLNRITSFNYDAAGRVIQQIFPDSRVIDFGYDANGNLIGVTPPGRPTHTFNYTAVDLLSAYIPPDVGAGTNQTGYVYNADRQVTAVTRPDGQVIISAYDNAGRLDTVALSRGVVDYSYQPTTGQVATITDPGGIGLVYTYDGDLLTQVNWTGPINGAVQFGYNNNFLVVSQTINSNFTANFQYDNDNLLTQAGGLSLSRNPQNGLLLNTTLANVADSRNYNNFGEVVSYNAAYSGSPLYNVAYDYDKLGRIITKTETISRVTSAFGYDYDLAGRLTTVRLNGTPVATYTYNSNGNRLSYTDSGGTVNGSYDDQDRLLQYGPTTYTYSANGELLSKTSGGQTTAYQYDELGNLLAATLPDSTQIEYLVDGENRRVGKRVNGSLVQGFLYRDGLKPMAELDGSNNVVAYFIYGSRANVPDYIVKGGVTYRILADHLGSPRLVVDVATGAVAQRMDYDAFGNIVADTNPGFQPFGFAGGLYDPATGLVRFGARDYDAEVGRWTAKDPIRFNANTNLYVYAHNNPINLVDLNGEEAIGAALTSLLGEVTLGEGAAFGIGSAIPAVGIAFGIGFGIGLAFSSDKSESSSSKGEACEPSQGSSSEHTSDQQALTKLAKEAKQQGGVTPEQAEWLKAWAEESNLSARGPESHPGRGHGAKPHIHIGPVDYIPVIYP